MASKDLRSNLSHNTRRAREVPSRYTPENSEYEFTRDVDRLWVQFEPLRKSVYRKLAPSVPSIADREDLISFINEQFVKLVKEYDPTSGVDFPGYISKMLLVRSKGLYVRPVNREHEREAQTTDEEILTQIDTVYEPEEEDLESVSNILEHVAGKMHLTDTDNKVIGMLSEGSSDKAIMSWLEPLGDDYQGNYLTELKSALAIALRDYSQR